MADWFLHTGLYLLGVALIPLAGLLLVCWGLWGDRSKGRPRCPKCWYDMRGSLPKLECPECGHDAKQERHLYRNRRHWGPLVPGIVLALLFSYPLRIVGEWCHEQSTVQGLTKRGHLVRSDQDGPMWLLDRLPEQYARLFDRAVTARLEEPATDADLAACRKLWGLYSISVSSTQVTAKGIAHLKGLPNLHHLALVRTQLSDAALGQLGGLTKLEDLCLSQTDVSDAGLEHLGEMPRLREMDLSWTHVTDAGLTHLTGLPRLRNLDLSHTQVTDAGVATLKQALPNVQIEWD